ncbi:MAG TPA: class I SAM-dependent methyltransferase [Terriglobales bacterium]|nr:class I SAM-dependent methyltransferase [Terriglobales bacterium]
MKVDTDKQVEKNESADNYQRYVEKRAANNAYWSTRALKHGTSLSATATTDWIRAATLKRLKRLVSPGCATLEIGCGNASSLLGPLSHYCSAYGADLTEEMLAVARRHHEKLKGLVRADVCWLPFRDKSFDLVYTSRCLINVLDREMQFLALREASRVAKPQGTVVLIENFQEPVDRLNHARTRWHAGEPQIDTHNLQLNLSETLSYYRQLGWDPVRVYSNSLATFTSQILVVGITRRDRPRLERVLSPLYAGLNAVEDRVGGRLPLFGKDTMVVFKRARTT